MAAAPSEDILERVRNEPLDAVPLVLEDFRTQSVPDHIQQPLRVSLEHQLQLLSQQAPRICFLGKTGSGKTSLMNAIIGRDLLPAEDTGEAVTSSVTEISHDPALAADEVVICAVVCSREEWDEKKRFLVEVLAGALAEDTGGSAEEEMQGLARIVLEAACPEVPAEQVRIETPECEAFLQRLSEPPQAMRFQSAAEAKAWLKDRVHLANSEDPLQSVLTTKVSISGKFEHIPRNLKLVDLPGLEDSNLLRSAVAERYFALFCNHAWFCLPKVEGRILSNRGIARQVRTLARGGNLKNVLVVRTRADESRRKKVADLDREHEQFKKLCRDELRLLTTRAGTSASSSSSAAEGSRGPEGEPPQSRRRLNDPADAQQGPEENVAFAGYVMATAAPESEGMAAEVEISGVLRKLGAVSEEQHRKAESVLRAVYAELQNMMMEEHRLAEEARAAEEALQREEARVAEEVRLTQEREEAEAAEAARREEENRAAREAELLRQQREESLGNFRAAAGRVSASIDSFRTHLQEGTVVQNINSALMGELRRLHHSTLRALIARGGSYTSASAGDIDLAETFAGAAQVSGQDLSGRFNSLVDRIGMELRPVLSGDLSLQLDLQLQIARGQLNAVLTRGGPVYSMLGRALHWPGGAGSTKKALQHAESTFADQRQGTRKALRDAAAMLCGTPSELLESLQRQMQMRMLGAGSHVRTQLPPPQQQLEQETALCIICEEAAAVTRALRVMCICNPRPPYSCMACVERIDLQYRRCPMCRGGQT
mmetsp:Transcript_63051/g.150233  ORF Transcript_63051/g.150233 Transcript_63051/m.150233 type:complete len:771 (+) Transcript_63051:51-2363(+)